MKETISLRLKPETIRALDSLAKAAGTSKGKLIESLADAAAADPYAAAIYEVAAHSDGLSAQMAFIRGELALIQRFGYSLEPQHLERWRILMEDLSASFAKKIAAEVREKVPV